MAKRKWITATLILTALWALMPPRGLGAGEAKPPNGWKDYRRQIHPKFPKKARASTRYIILHSSEAGLQSSLETLSRGKRFKRSRYQTHGGHAHYLIDRGGRIYYILDEKYRADHAGLSLWDGTYDLSSHALGIELVAYADGDITDKQYESLTYLVTTMRLKYKIPERNILTHAHVAYGRPNPWFSRNHRGRKRDGINIDLGKLGITETWSYDPDVKAGRLQSDPMMTKLLYSRKRVSSQPKQGEVAPPADTALTLIPPKDNIIRNDNTAWTIAAEDYDSPETLYILPDGQQIRGDQVERRIGWQRLPAGTEVRLYQAQEEVSAPTSPIKLISENATAWSYAGPAYRARTTFYITPNGKILAGNQVRDWDQLAEGTRMLINYQAPRAIGAVRGKTPWSMARERYNHPETIYFLPPGKLVSGADLTTFSGFPKGSVMFLPLDKAK